MACPFCLCLVTKTPNLLASNIDPPEAGVAILLYYTSHAQDKKKGYFVCVFIIVQYEPLFVQGSDMTKGLLA